MKMAEVAGIAASDDEIELDLGLSIGGRFTKSSEESISRGRDGRTGLSRSRLALSGTSTFDSPSLTLVSDGDDESAIMNSKERCEILVSRRREAKRKREEMQQKRGRDFACQNEEEERQWRLLKKEKQDELGSRCDVMKNLDLNLSDDQVFDRENYRTNASLPKQVPPEQMLYPYSSFQYVPFVNGYAFPWVIPYWVAGADIKHGNEKIVRHPVACRSFRPFQMNQNITDVDSLNGCKSEQNVSEDGGNWKTGSCESTLCSSSVVSDNYQSSSSHEGGSSSSYTRSNLSNSSSVQHPLTGLNASDDVNNTPSSHHVEPMPNSDNRTHCSEKFVQSHVSTARPAGKSGIKEEFAISTDHEVPSSKTISNTFKSTPITRKNNKMENRKPPKPQTQSCHIPSLLQMPRVSTTGTGQNGKTIVGILHRYSKSEVSILCVCHGESFSPAEFVKHAGGAEVSHPLRHITVLPTDGGLPSAFR